MKKLIAGLLDIGSADGDTGAGDARCIAGGFHRGM